MELINWRSPDKDLKIYANWKENNLKRNYKQVKKSKDRTLYDARPQNSKAELWNSRLNSYWMIKHRKDEYVSRWIKIVSKDGRQEEKIQGHI